MTVEEKNQFDEALKKMPLHMNKSYGESWSDGFVINPVIEGFVEKHICPSNQVVAYKRVSIYDDGWIGAHWDATTNSPWRKMAVITVIREGDEDHRKSVAFGYKGDWGILNVGNWTIYGANWFVFHKPLRHAVLRHRHPPLGFFFCFFFPQY